jgi:outer membrane protein
MKQILITSSLLLMLKISVFGQNIVKISLAEATKLALTNAEDLKNMKLDYQIQEHKNKEVVATALPQVALSGGGTYYTNLPKIQFPTSDFGVYKVLETEGVKDAAGQPINVSKATFGSQEVSFQAPLNFQFGLGINQLLFQPDVFVAYKAREKVLDFKAANTAVAEVKAKEAVHKAYYSVLIAQKQKEVLVSTIERLVKVNGEMSEMLKAGFIERLDVDKLSVSINNAQTAINQLDNAILISSSLLKNAIGVADKDSLVLTEQLDVNQIKALLVTKDNNFNYQSRKEIQLLEIGKNLQSLDLERNKLGNRPTVAAFYNIQRAGQRNKLFAGPDGSGSPWFWNTTGLVGLSVNQPVFDGGQRKNRIAVSKLELQKIDNNLQLVKDAIDMEQSIAYASLKNAMLNLDVQDRNKALAQSVFDQTKVKYQAGVGTSFELLQADTELQRAQGNYFQALYDGYISKINMDKALGKL